MNDNRAIGVFDSGVGGLTVLKYLVKKLPYEDYIYFGDTARVPYGDKSKEALIIFAREILDWFASLNVKAVLMACNTSSAVALNILKNDYDFPVFGLIEPVSEYISTLESSKIGVMATSATVNSKAYSSSILSKSQNKEVFEIACPGLVEIVESNRIGSIEAKNLLSKYLNPLTEKGVEKIVLGCTHYPFLSETIREITGKDDILIDPAFYLTEFASKELNKKGLLSNKNNGEQHYFVSANPEKFAKTGRIFMPDLKTPKLVRTECRGSCSLNA
jgi:glutamate racemase